MFLDVKELAVHKLNIRKSYTPGNIDYHTAELKQVEPLDVLATAELIDSQIRITGRLETKIELQCARCLEPVVEDVQRHFDLFYSPLPKDTKPEEEGRRAAERFGCRYWVLQGRWAVFGGCAGRTSVAGGAHEGHLPKRLPWALRGLRSEFESRRMPVRDACNGPTIGSPGAVEAGLA